jgi:hypothetical protein
MTKHEGLVFDPHTIMQLIVGFGKDALEPNVILSEFNDGLGESNTINQPIVDTEVPRHRSAGNKALPSIFRYTLEWQGGANEVLRRTVLCSSHNGRNIFIQNTVLKVLTAALSCYGFNGFIVDTLAAVGASENRSANKMMATIITAKDIFGDMFSEGETAEYIHWI